MNFLWGVGTLYLCGSLLNANFFESGSYLNKTEPL